MAEFTTNVDIGNRALQHCGDLRISSFTEASRQAREVSFAYDKLRKAELRRNLWKFATKRVVLRPLDITTYQLVPAAWSASNIYIMGSVVTYGGFIYICTGFKITGATTPDVSPDWVPYFGPLTVSLYDSDASYFPGELVYTPATEGYVVFMALAYTDDVPGAFALWDVSTPYNRGQSVVASHQLQFTPGNLPVFFSPGGLPVNGVQIIVQSLLDLNAGNDPIVATTPNWQVIPAAGQPDYDTGLNWLRLDAKVQSILTPYPLTAGPKSDPRTLNAYRLPNNYLRQAPTDPKAGMLQPLGAPSNPWPEDFVFESVYIVTSRSDPITFRFVADMYDVTLMDGMFCEGLAARIAFDVGPSLIEKDVRAQTLARIRDRYREVMGEARELDAIERGPTTSEIDEYIAVRR